MEFRKNHRPERGKHPSELHNHPTTILKKTRRHHHQFGWCVAVLQLLKEPREVDSDEKSPINPKNDVLTFSNRTDIFSRPPHHKLAPSWPLDVLGNGWKPPKSEGRGRHGDDGTGTTAYEVSRRKGTRRVQPSLREIICSGL